MLTAINTTTIENDNPSRQHAPHHEMQHILLNYIYVTRDIIIYPRMIHFSCLSQIYQLINLKIKRILKTNKIK